MMLRSTRRKSRKTDRGFGRKKTELTGKRSQGERKHQREEKKGRRRKVTEVVELTNQEKKEADVGSWTQTSRQ